MALAAYTCLILYGSLFPFSGWMPQADAWELLLQGQRGAHLSLPDLVVNALIYIPLGVCLRIALQRHPWPLALLVAGLFGGMLSLGVEWAQAHMPQRVPALSDLFLNTAGALTGALAGGLFNRQHRMAARVQGWRARHFRCDALADLSLLALLGWAAAQLAPFIPSFDIGLLRAGFSPLAGVLSDPARYTPVNALIYALQVMALALLARDARLRGARIGPALWSFFLAVLIAKAFVISRQISAEALSGTVAGLALALLLPRHLRPWRPALAALVLMVAETLSQLEPDIGPMRTLNLVPFLAHLNNPMLGLAVLLDSAWPYLALSAALASAGLIGRPRIIVLFCAGFAFALEWLQQSVPGRVPDVTTAVVALFAAWLATRLLRRISHAASSPPAGRAWLAIAFSLLSCVPAALWMLASTPPAVARSSASAPMLPAPEALMPADIPAFRVAHPRLPHPDARDIARLRSENPGFILDTVSRARGGQGDLNAVILAEMLQPGSQDMRALTTRLLALKPTWRGHEQTKPIALAYDWLHERIPPDLRPAMLDKVADACNYQIHVIRTERMSPYNVYLYNSPFQALMACAIALYRDDPRGGPVMAFTEDYWRNRVLPVWRQIGGRNGGWHEGQEYVGIGIGQAIYQLPAMWRSATGEDLFAREPALRGFLDFLIHRLRPDGSAERWGDGRFPRRDVPDAIALALEYRHAAAYTLFAPRERRIGPTAWPWGPLPDDTLRDPSAIAALPLTHVADGLGLVLTRTSWREDATFISFKAGDNYWSHSHLDQGAFTVFKGAALALDSGCYCGYGKDHHLNYHYQTIAHNTLTVTDPADDLPLPARKDKPPRPIANDGGQRRVGSGWDLSAAPLDLGDWESKYADFHTGRLVAVHDRDDLLVALADITPAYTNKDSGNRLFHARSRRVEKAWRIFIHDRRSDVFVVYDDIEATQPEFTKRWLLHGALAPRIDGRRFTLERPADTVPGARAQLQGEVVFPRDAQLLPIGGPGFEFFAGERNFDDDGAVQDMVARNARDIDAGTWRLEVMPAQGALRDRFLVVMRAGLDAGAPPQVTPLEDADGLGARVQSAGRTLTVKLSEDRLAADVSADGPEGRRSARVTGDGNRAPAEGWLQALRRLLAR